MMNGFSSDIVSILKHNLMVHNKSIGLLLGTENNPDMRELMSELDKRNMLSSGGYPGHWSIKWDYIVIPGNALRLPTVLKSLARLNSGGVIILEITGKGQDYESKYSGIAETMTATKLKFEDRIYLVIHSGVDYGN